MSGINKSLLALSVGALMMSGCMAPLPEETYPLISQPLSGPKALDMQGSSYQAADAMLVKLHEKLRARGVTILPASFVDERNMDKTSPFGRLISRQFANRFTQGGFSMVEIKLRKNVLLERGAGQFVMTRELEKIRDTHNVHAVLAGSYVTTDNRVFVSAQLVRLSDGVTLAAEDFDVPLTREVRSLLAE